MSGQGWGVWADSSIHERYAMDAPNKRRRCSCGCGGPITHIGCCNGLAMMSGCEWRVRKWVQVQGAAPRNTVRVLSSLPSTGETNNGH
jgi:hypothetical protein